ncbi:hypothetical protein [Enterococcus alishanensis]
MEFSKMTNEQLKTFLDEHNIDYRDAKIKADYLQLAEQVEIEQLDEPEENRNKLVDKVKSAIKIEQTETKTVDTVSYLKDRDYSQLTVGERAMIREQSPEYESQNDGVEVTISNRLATEGRIVKLADRSYSKLLKGVQYKLSKADFDVLKDVQVRVKTEATKNKCCGQAQYESVSLLELANG